jgi:hypothetical protein
MSPDKKTEDKPPTVTRFFRACLLILGGLIALSFALQLASHIWVWLVLLAAAGLIVGGTIWYLRWRRDRRW